MPSIDQGDASASSVAALPSTLEIFDKFKPTTDNGKDSDSEESFHLVLEDDDVEGQPAVSNAKDKQKQNEETEDDILNKFETLQNGTGDNVDPSIEDRILDDIEDEAHTRVTNEENVINSDANPVDIQEECENSESNAQVTIASDFGYEDSADGEFKSIYEIDATAEKDTLNGEESETAVETQEPMEVADEPIIDGEARENISNPDATNTDSLGTFEDCMDVEQENAKDDIINIIEKLDDEDAPMENPEPSSNLDLNQDDVNMDEFSKTSEVNEEENNDIPEADQHEFTKTPLESLNNDVEMPESTQDGQEENVEPENHSLEATFQELVDVPETHTEDANSYQTEVLDSDSPFQNIDQDDNETPAEECSTVLEPVDAPHELTAAVDEIKADELELQKSDINSSETQQESLELTEAEDQEAVLKDSEIESDSTLITRGTEPEDFLLKELDDTINETNNAVEKVEESEDKMQAEVQEHSEDENKDIEDEESLIKTEDVMPQISEEDSKKEDDAELEVEQNKEKLDEHNEIGNEECKNEESEKLVSDAENENNHTDIGHEEYKNGEGEKCVSDAVKENSHNEIGNEEFRDRESEKNATAAEGKNNESDVQQEKSSAVDKSVFKVPEEIPIKEETEGPDFCNDKSNDKTDEDDLDLLDISMVRETEEDDACAMAESIAEEAMEDTDKEMQASEKSDEEQSEKMDTEQDGSDTDNKDRDSNDDNEVTIGFDDLDDDSRMDDGDDSSNADSSSQRKEISDSSKDSTCDGDSSAVRRFKVSSDVVPKLEEQADDLDSTTKDAVISDQSVPSIKIKSETDESVAQNDNAECDSSKTNEGSSEARKQDDDTEKLTSESSSVLEDMTKESEETTESDTDQRRTSSLNKRSRSACDLDKSPILAKKSKLEPEPQEETPVAEKLQTLTAFSKFMQCRKLAGKLSRSDLEQFCIQKICESLMLKSSEGELHQTVKKHEKTIEALRKDLVQLTKQCKDLEIVNKKLMNELKSQNPQKKPIVPLKITRSVGLQVRLNPGNEVANNRRRPMATTPQKQVAQSPNANMAAANRVKTVTAVQTSPAVRQVLQNSSPQKPSPLTSQTSSTVTQSTMLSQALQKRPVLAKRPTAPPPVRKPVEVSKPSAPGVIDLTDEDDKTAQNKAVGVKAVNKTPNVTPNKALANKMSGGKTIVNQGKPMAKAVTVGGNKGNNLSQGIRLTPASVITSTSNGSPQMVYVVPTITSNSGGQQKVAFVNFQPSNGVLSGTLNGSPVSVMQNKSGQTLTLKTVPNSLRLKHPAPLPTPPRINLDTKLKPLLPKPMLTIKKIDTGIILQWKMPYKLDMYENIASYQLYAYQETTAAPSTDMWRKVGDVKALALPMACTLTQFADKNKYYFAVRSVDVHKRIGAFSDPEEISL